MGSGLGCRLRRRLAPVLGLPELDVESELLDRGVFGEERDGRGGEGDVVLLLVRSGPGRGRGRRRRRRRRRRRASGRGIEAEPFRPPSRELAPHLRRRVSAVILQHVRGMQPASERQGADATVAAAARRGQRRGRDALGDGAEHDREEGGGPDLTEYAVSDLRRRNFDCGEQRQGADERRDRLEL